MAADVRGRRAEPQWAARWRLRPDPAPAVAGACRPQPLKRASWPAPGRTLDPAVALGVCWLQQQRTIRLGGEVSSVPHA